MADLLRTGPVERDVEQAIIALKKGSHLLKYGRRGKPKFCPFRLSNDESLLIWYSGKEEKQLKLSSVSKIIPGQRTAIFQRYPRPEKEYQSFSLIYSDRSLDLICKDKDEAEVWFVGLKALISHGSNRKWRVEPRSDRASSDTNSPFEDSRKPSPLSSPLCNSELFQKELCDTQRTSESPPRNGLGKVFSDVILYTAPSRGSIVSDLTNNPLGSFSSGGGADNQNGRGSAAETFRVSLSSAVSSSSHGSGHEDFDALGDVYLWGEGIGDGFLGGGLNRVGSSSMTKIDALLPKALEPAVVLDVHSLACGSRHAILVTKQCEVFSWGEESGGRLGHGVDADVPQPKLIDALGGLNIELVACGEYHTCAVTMSGDLYTWGDGAHNFGLLGHGGEVSHWIPKKVNGQLEGLHVSSISCGPWHTAVVTSSGKLFTFGDATFGALGHGDHKSTNMPREVESLKGLRTVHAACGVWHTAAIVVVPNGSPESSGSSGKVFTWGDGDKGRLGHGDRQPRLLPTCVGSLDEPSFCRVSCGHDITVALSNSGRVYTMGSNVYGQLGKPEADGKHPIRVEGNLSNSYVEEIACGSYHVAVLTSKTEVYTWGKGGNGRLGHGDTDDRFSPTLVEALKDKQVKSITCGSNFTASICLHKWPSSADQTICSGCRLPFGFRRKRHNCYNCGLVFCKACSSQKSLKACLAPNINKPYRVCDECYTKLKKAMESGKTSQFTKHQNANLNDTSTDVSERGNLDQRTLGQLSRLSSVDSFKITENRPSRQNGKGELNGRFSPIFNASSPWGSLYSSKSSNCISGPSRKIFSASVPTSRMASRATSPVSKRDSPPGIMTLHNGGDITRPNELCDDQINKTDDESGLEIARLRLQVGNLTRKSRLLEAELERTTMKLKEATEKAGKESAKCIAAKEVIKSLTAQLKDMPQRNEDSKTNGFAASNDPSTLNICSTSSNEIISTVTDTPKKESQWHHSITSCNGNRAPTEETEWVEQVEPGVYITVSSFPGGDKYLKRVRFSRKRFSEQQAERWWAENRLRLQEKYSVVASEKIQ